MTTGIITNLLLSQRGRGSSCSCFPVSVRLCTKESLQRYQWYLVLRMVQGLAFCGLGIIKSEAPHDLHTHLLSSKSTRSPRQVQLTLPYGVSRQRSLQPPFMCRHGDSSPSITIKHNWLGGQKQSKEKSPGTHSSELSFEDALWLTFLLGTISLSLTRLLYYCITGLIPWDIVTEFGFSA